ncbi:MAG: hypothetical protein ABEJ04_02095, partial [Halobacteriaceae archaeon]
MRFTDTSTGTVGAAGGELDRRRERAALRSRPVLASGDPAPLGRSAEEVAEPGVLSDDFEV